MSVFVCTYIPLHVWHNLSMGISQKKNYTYAYIIPTMLMLKLLFYLSCMQNSNRIDKFVFKIRKKNYFRRGMF